MLTRSRAKLCFEPGSPLSEDPLCHSGCCHVWCRRTQRRLQALLCLFGIVVFGSPPPPGCSWAPCDALPMSLAFGVAPTVATGYKGQSHWVWAKAAHDTLQGTVHIARGSGGAGEQGLWRSSLTWTPREGTAVAPTCWDLEKCRHRRPRGEERGSHRQMWARAGSAEQLTERP